MEGTSGSGVATLNGGLELVSNPFAFDFSLRGRSLRSTLFLLLEVDDMVEGKGQANGLQPQQIDKRSQMLLLWRNTNNASPKEVVFSHSFPPARVLKALS